LKLAGPGLAAAATIWVARMAAVARHSAVLPSVIFALVLGYGIFLASLLLFGMDDDDRALIELGRALISAMFAGYNQKCDRMTSCPAGSTMQCETRFIVLPEQR